MSAITFDTLKFVDVLEQAKLPREQARAIVDVVRESRETTLAEQANIAQSATAELDTKTGRAIASAREDIADVRKNMDVRFAKVDGELKLLKWMLGMLITINLTVLAGVISLVVMLIKTFF